MSPVSVTIAGSTRASQRVKNPWIASAVTTPSNTTRSPSPSSRACVSRAAFSGPPPTMRRVSRGSSRSLFTASSSTGTPLRLTSRPTNRSSNGSPASRGRRESMLPCSTAAAPNGIVTVFTSGEYSRRRCPVYADITVTASDASTTFRITGANTRLVAPSHVSSAEKNVDTSAASDALRAATPNSPCGIGQKACTTSNRPSRAILAAAREPAAT